MNLNPYQRAILQELERARRPLTTRRIAQRSMIAWPTAKRHLKKMEEKRLVIKTTRGNRILWEFNLQP